MARSSASKPCEETTEWREAVERLCERFPTFSHARVSGALRESEGHAGHAAASLRDLSSAGMRPIDPEDAEYVKTILSSPTIFTATCQELFQKYDLNSNSSLEWDEILTLTNSLYQSFGLELPREGGLRDFFAGADANQDGVLQLSEFATFFERFLRVAYGQQRTAADGRPGVLAVPVGSPPSLRSSPLRSQVMLSPSAEAWHTGEAIRTPGQRRSKHAFGGDLGVDLVTQMQQQSQLSLRQPTVGNASFEGGSRRRSFSTS